MGLGRRHFAEQPPRPCLRPIWGLPSAKKAQRIHPHAQVRRPPARPRQIVRPQGRRAGGAGDEGRPRYPPAPKFLTLQASSPCPDRRDRLPAATWRHASGFSGPGISVDSGQGKSKRAASPALPFLLIFAGGYLLRSAVGSVMAPLANGRWTPQEELAEATGNRPDSKRVKTQNPPPVLGGHCNALRLASVFFFFAFCQIHRFVRKPTRNITTSIIRHPPTSRSRKPHWLCATAGIASKVHARKKNSSRSSNGQAQITLMIVSVFH